MLRSSWYIRSCCTAMLHFDAIILFALHYGCHFEFVFPLNRIFRFWCTKLCSYYPFGSSLYQIVKIVATWSFSFWLLLCWQRLRKFQRIKVNKNKKVVDTATDTDLNSSINSTITGSPRQNLLVEIKFCIKEIQFSCFLFISIIESHCDS